MDGYQSLIIEEHILWNLELVECETPIPHYSGVLLVGEHPIEQGGEDPLLDLHVPVPP